MKTPSPELLTAMSDPERYGIVLFTFTLGVNVYGLQTMGGEITYNSIVYRGGASVLKVDGIQNNADGSVAEFNLTLNEDPSKGLTVDVLSSFYDENWHMQSLVVELGFRNPVDGSIIGAMTYFDGLIYQAPLKRGPDGFYITARCVSQATHMSESGGKFRNRSTQKLLDATDTSLDEIGAYSSVVTKEFKWGQA